MNYCPVSLASICSKLLEHIIHSNIMSHLNACNIISDNQYGFCKRQSVALQLIRTIHDFAYNLYINERKQTDAILLDFCNAFDKVSHCHLKLKLGYYRIGNQTLKWISSFLEECTQCVVCGGYTSGPANVISGIPQGTVLGAPLF